MTQLVVVPNKSEAIAIAGRIYDAGGRTMPHRRLPSGEFGVTFEHDKQLRIRVESPDGHGERFYRASAPVELEPLLI